MFYSRNLKPPAPRIGIDEDDIQTLFMCSCVSSVNTALLANTQGILPRSIVVPLTSFALTSFTQKENFIYAEKRDCWNTDPRRVPSDERRKVDSNVFPIAWYCWSYSHVLQRGFTLGFGRSILLYWLRREPWERM